jgi:hypothetical protein
LGVTKYRSRRVGEDDRPLVVVRFDLYVAETLMNVSLKISKDTMESMLIIYGCPRHGLPNVQVGRVSPGFGSSRFGNSTWLASSRDLEMSHESANSDIKLDLLAPRQEYRETTWTAVLSNQGFVHRMSAKRLRRFLAI